MGYVKISGYFVRDNPSLRLRRTEWHMREYILSSKYLHPNKVERKKVLITLIVDTSKEEKGNNDNNQNDGGKSMMEITQSPQAGQQNDDVLSSLQQQIMQSLQALQLQHSSY
ncbi:hypothetical protein P3S67_005682 [Capsicum chacoense]